MLDTLIKNVSIVDGSKQPKYIGNAGIKDGKLVLKDIYDHSNAHLVIDGAGLTLCPGFIDGHSHNDLQICEDIEGYALCKINQGITTEIGGQCGVALFPVKPVFLKEAKGTLTSFITEKQMDLVDQFTDFSQYLAHINSLPKPQNFAFLCGHGTLRTAAMGVANRRPTQIELESMKEYLREAMENGCLGLSSGLIYTPGVYAETEELVELCKVIKDYGGIYATHMRNEAGHVLDSVKESIYIAETAKVPLVISHHKICGKDNWGLSKKTLQLVHDGIARGMSITLDQYPYIATQTYLNVCLPPKYFAEGMENLLVKLKDSKWREIIKQEIENPQSGYENSFINCGGFDGILILSSPNVKEACGLTVAEYAKTCNKTDFDAYFDLLIENKGSGLAAYFCVSESDIENIYLDESTIPGTDGIITLDDSPCHPRTYGSFVRTLVYFSKEKNLLSFEEAVYKQTYLPALRWNLKNKGLIKDGYDADLVLLDYNALYDSPNFKNGRALCDGITSVFVNGEIIYQNKKLTGFNPGKCILRN